MSANKLPIILLRHRDIPDIDNLEVYRQNGGFDAYRQVVTGHETGGSD